MVQLAPSRLTKLGFRRDVNVFMAALVGFLVVLIFALLTLLKTFLNQTEDAYAQSWTSRAELAFEFLEKIDPKTQRVAAETEMVYLRGRFSIPAITVRWPGGKIESGDVTRDQSPVTRSGRLGIVTFHFDATPLRNARRQFGLMAAICITAALTGMVLLLLYLPRITRPIEELLDHAREVGAQHEDEDETRYVIETFKHSIATMRAQEEELRRLHSQEKMRADDLARITATLKRSLTSGFIAIDAQGNILEINAAGREILRMAELTEPIGKSVREALGNSSFSRVLERSVSQRSTVTREEVDHESVAVGLTTVPLHSEEDHFLGILALFTDLTPIRTLEGRLRAMQTLADLGEISAGIAHEFRNSLSTILGYLKLARRESLPEQASQRLSNAEEEANLLSGAVEGLLHFARPMSLEMETTSLRSVVDPIVSRFAEQEPDITFKLDGDACEIEGDRRLLARALENLLRNSIDAVKEKAGAGSIIIRCEKEPWPRLTVADDGAGINSAEIPRLFLPFQSNKPAGMGLGLPLTRKIILIHGGTIDMKSEPGVGTTVTIEFRDDYRNLRDRES